MLRALEDLTKQATGIVQTAAVKAYTAVRPRVDAAAEFIVVELEVLADRRRAATVDAVADYLTKLSTIQPSTIRDLRVVAEALRQRADSR